MNHKNIIKSIVSISLISLLTGCTVTQPGTFTQAKSVEEKKIDTVKQIENTTYERPVVSELLKNRIRDILKAMAANDLTKINRDYIHPEFGFFNLFKIEGSKVYLGQKIIYNIVDDQSEELSHIVARINSNSSKLKIIEKNVKFDCSPNDDEFYGWNDDGLFLSNKIDTLLSKMMKELYDNDLKDYEKAIRIEKTSYKVVLTPELSFYLTYIDDNWYITLVDRITSDCSSLKD